MTPFRPERLKFGDVIGVVAPASAPAKPENIDLGLAALEQLGFIPKPAANLRKRWGFLAGTDQERADDLMEMFLDRTVKGILCFRGGYGSARLLPFLDFELIRQNAKIFVGYSDITSLHAAFLVRSGMVSFHGPMLNSDFLKPNMPEFTRNSFFRTLMTGEAAGSITKHYSARKRIKSLVPGIAKGPLVGGNISILCASLGTPWQPSFANAIVFFEDVGEEPYRYDRLLTQLLNSGLLEKAAGFAIGTNKNCRDPQAGRTPEFRQSLEDVLLERLEPLGKPLVLGLPFGHIRMNATLPLGVEAILDANRGDLIVTQPAVS